MTPVTRKMAIWFHGIDFYPNVGVNFIVFSALKLWSSFCIKTFIELSFRDYSPCQMLSRQQLCTALINKRRQELIIWKLFIPCSATPEHFARKCYNYVKLAKWASRVKLNNKHQKLIWHNNNRKLQPDLLLFILIFCLEKEVKVGSSVRYDAKNPCLVQKREKCLFPKIIHGFAS